MSPWGRTAAAVLTLALVAGPVPFAAADDDLSDGLDLSAVGDLGRFITDLRIERFVSDLRLPEPSDIEQRSTDGEDTVITLDADILFDFGTAELGTAAATRIAQIVDALPERTPVRVGGHTDSIGTDEFNLQLSEERAQAVADVIAATRPDLSLEVEGFGESEPIAANEQGGEDNPEGRALNRRVELRYAGD